MTRRANIFRQLKVDHDRQRRLLDGILAPSLKDEERLRLLRALCEELRAHAAAEEQTFYAELLAHSPHEVQQSVTTNDEVEELILQLSELEWDGADWRTVFVSLKEKVESHLDREETLLFPQARRLIKWNRAKWLAERFEQIKERELSLGGPQPISQSSAKLRHPLPGEAHDRPALAAVAVPAKV